MDSIIIEKNRIQITIPFEKINSFQIVSNKINDKASIRLNKTQIIVVKSMKDNPNITVNQLTSITGLSEQGIKKNLKILKDNKVIERIGANKNGYWKVN